MTSADETGSAVYRTQMQAAADLWEMDEVHGFMHVMAPISSRSPNGPEKQECTNTRASRIWKAAQVAYEPAMMERRHLVMTSRCVRLVAHPTVYPSSYSAWIGT